jgi:hypothetical protein
VRTPTTKCCGKRPRCRTCPLFLAREARDVLPPLRSLPPHLDGVPRSLHKYEPLLRRAWEQRERV